MPPLQILFLTVWPIMDMRLTCKSNGKEYPPEVPCEITKVLELETVSNNKTKTILARKSSSFPFTPCNIYERKSFADKMEASRDR